MICGGAGAGKSAFATRLEQKLDNETCVLDTVDVATQGSTDTGVVAAAHGFLLIYPITNRDLFEGMSTFREQVLQARNTKSVPMVLVATKQDLETQRAVSRDEGWNLASSWGVPILETSAVDGLGIDEALCTLIREIHAINATPAVML